MIKSIPAVFLDRDGTINFDYGYVYEISTFRFIEGVIDAMFELKKMGYALIIVTNQSGIARGKFTETQFQTLTKWIEHSLNKFNINLDGIYYCPHLPQGEIQKYRKICNCRKPHIGMLQLAQTHFHIDMKASFMVGDKLEDMQSAESAGIGTKVLVHSGNLITETAKESADWLINSLSDLPKEIKKLKNSYYVN